MSLKTIIKRILPKPFNDTLHKGYHNTIILSNKFRWALRGKRTANPKNIPIIINNYNRLTYLHQLIVSLTKRGYNNIHILDNDSTYPPLLEYYKSCPFQVYHLGRNFGYKALWESGMFDRFKHSYYVYTDADMEICPECPEDFMQHFIDVLKSYPLAQKVGFGLRIDDLPDHFVNKDKVIEHESQFWLNEVEPGLYRAAIDTTFALYRPYCKGVASIYHQVYRTGEPYVIKHLPWYVDTKNMTHEELYYVESIKKPTHWSEQSKA